MLLRAEANWRIAKEVVAVEDAMPLRVLVGVSMSGPVHQHRTCQR